ncbi:uncharacterized protein A1O9_09263 [Exophiala aquamarina CBS 119918]|uniref:RmlD-like substrate binding domain-containing protein n=1 Tax=Exophiala aquamarina CBS 119918 TaxID=1182545 RepID=A0A072P4S2_9EURO|nr:uncharacterized protein A1O9_09263 [Exophiala aquamarina CBS 119918]KEF54821.1 hypothetical protein A1O9_09263 [Exophiala aquamarina CBS 119918]
MPRALITGATGLLGRAVLSAFQDAGYEATGTGFSRASDKILKLDIRDKQAVDKVFDEVKPEVVVHCAADRQPDSCTQHPDAARLLNVTATEHLAQACASHGALLIYISTDYVFPGVEGESPYTVSSTPKPTNIYGQTKLDGERVVQKYPRTTSLRVPVLYGTTVPEDNNAESAVNILLDALWRSQKDKQPAETVKMDDWAVRTPTNTADVARVCVDIAGHDGPVPQILQFSSDDRMTKYEMCRIFAEIMDLPFDGIVPVKDGGKPGPDGTLRPKDCHMDTDELRKLGVSVETVDFVAWWRKKLGAYRH